MLLLTVSRRVLQPSWARRMFPTLTVCRSLASDKSRFPFRRKFPTLDDTHGSSANYEDEVDPSYCGQRELIDANDHAQLLKERFHLEALKKQSLMVIQPFFRLGQHARMNTSRDLMMRETLGLVDTLGWHVADRQFVGLERSDADRRSFFGSGQLERLRNRIFDLEAETSEDSEDGDDKSSGWRRSSPIPVTAVFVSTFSLTSPQRAFIEEALGKPVLDRYHIVLEIFRRYSRTREAKLQVELAEIPYLVSRLQGEYEIERISKHDPSLRRGEDFFSLQRHLLAIRQKKLNALVEKSVKHRRQLRNKRRRNLSPPSVAVVGYTNAGKTSLIKALTGEERLRPCNRMFSTLDVTFHQCLLPSNLRVFLLDTVGFISDLPTSLVASFSATLEDAASADVLIHVRDVSHPDHVSQFANVCQTLRQLRFPSRLLVSDGDSGFDDNDSGTALITVGNKIDLIHPKDWKAIKEDGCIPISAVTGYGLDFLRTKLEEALIRVTGMKVRVMRVPTAGPELVWLRKNVTVCAVKPYSADANYSDVTVMLKDLEFNRFKKIFIGKMAVTTDVSTNNSR